MRLTESGNAERLVEVYGNDIVHCPEMKAWYIWNGKRWVEDVSDHIFQMAKHIARLYIEDAEQFKDDTNYQTKMKHIRWSATSESLKGLRAMADIAKSEDNMTIKVDMFDRDPMLLNVLNGILNLETRNLMRFDRNFNITKTALVNYTRGAKNKMWLQFLKDVQPDPQIRDFIQAALGYSLTSSMEEDRMFILHGGGCNGKTTFTGTILKMLGDYAAQASSSAFTAKKSSGPSNDLLVLIGKRFVCAAETDEAHCLNETLVKRLTGGERESINPKYRSQIEFYPTWKIWLSTNHEPTIKGGDAAIWNRIIKIPFNVTIPNPNRKLRYTLFNSLEGRSGILNWALDGLSMWKESGLIIPKAVEDATRRYRSEQDLIGQFIQDKCQIHPDLKISKTDLYSTYNYYCKSINQTPKSDIHFGKRLIERGIIDTRKRGSRMWKGIGIDKRVNLYSVEVG